MLHELWVVQNDVLAWLSGAGRAGPGWIAACVTYFSFLFLVNYYCPLYIYATNRFVGIVIYFRGYFGSRF